MGLWNRLRRLLCSSPPQELVRRVTKLTPAQARFIQTDFGPGRIGAVREDGRLVLMTFQGNYDHWPIDRVLEAYADLS